MSSFKRRLLVGSTLGLLLLWLPGAALAQDVAPSDPWPQTHSDLTPDGRVRFGVLANGMRYAIRRNATPPGQTSLRLRIDAGSLVEQDDQRGLAHFMEHMAFNGTTNLPENKLVTTLEGLGLRFGADTNASTGFDETVYQLDLPRSDPETLATGLMVLREQAANSLMDSAAIDAERGVIAGEERSRNTPQLRAAIATYALLAPRLAARVPIGDMQVIATAPRERFAAFYDAYYRPSRTTLFAVGDFDLQEMEDKVRVAFGDWTPRGPDGPEPLLEAVLAPTSDVRILIEPGMPYTAELIWTRAPDRDPDSQQERHLRLLREIGLGVFNERIDKLSRTDSPPFSSAYSSVDQLFDLVDTTTIQAQFPPDGLERALSSIEQEQRRITTYGVSEGEVRRQVLKMRTQLERRVAGAETESTRAIVAALWSRTSAKEVWTSRQTDLKLFEESVRGLTAPAVGRALSSAFEGSGPVALVQTPIPIEGGEDRVRAVLSGSRAVPVAERPADEDGVWPYTDFGPSGHVSDRRYIEDIDTHVVTFANGVVLTVKPTKLREEEVLVSVTTGAGELSFPADRYEPILQAFRTFIPGGLGRMTYDQVRDVLAGRVYSIQLEPRQDRFEWSGVTRNADLPTQMQVLAAYVTDAGMREGSFDTSKREVATAITNLLQTPAGAWQYYSPKALTNGDLRAAIPEPEVAETWDIKAIAPIFRASMNVGPLKVMIVGDTNVDDAIAATASTFGALPPRSGLNPLADRTRTFPAGGQDVVSFHHTGPANQALAFVGWPAVDAVGDRTAAREVSLLSAVLTLRVLDEIRERRSIAYAPGAYFSPSDTYENYGYIGALAEVAPENLEPFFEAMEQIAADLRDRPVTEEDLNRARAPIIAQLRQAEKGNDMWMTWLEDIDDDPLQIEQIETRISDYETLTPRDVQRLAQTYLVDARVWRATVTAEP